MAAKPVFTAADPASSCTLPNRAFLGEGITRYGGETIRLLVEAAVDNLAVTRT